MMLLLIYCALKSKLLFKNDDRSIVTDITMSLNNSRLKIWKTMFQMDEFSEMQNINII